MNKIKPMRDLVLVELDESNPVTKSGIVRILDEYWDDHTWTGTVLAHGPACSTVKEGSRVLVEPYKTHDQARSGKIQILVPEEELIGVL